MRRPGGGDRASVARPRGRALRLLACASQVGAEGRTHTWYSGRFPGVHAHVRSVELSLLAQQLVALGKPQRRGQHTVEVGRLLPCVTSARRDAAASTPRPANRSKLDRDDPATLCAECAVVQRAAAAAAWSAVGSACRVASHAANGSAAAVAADAAVTGPTAVVAPTALPLRFECSARQPPSKYVRGTRRKLPQLSEHVDPNGYRCVPTIRAVASLPDELPGCRAAAGSFLTQRVPALAVPVGRHPVELPSLLQSYVTAYGLRACAEAQGGARGGAHSRRKASGREGARRRKAKSQVLERGAQSSQDERIEP